MIDRDQPSDRESRMPRHDDPAARRAELLARVGDRMEPGESLREAVWFTRVPGRRTAGEILGAEFQPGRLVEDAAWGAVGATAGTGPGVDWYQQARGGVLAGPPGCVAVGLDAVLPDVSTAQVLVATDRRLLVLRRPAVVSPAGPVAAGPGGLLSRLHGAFEQVRAAWDGPAAGAAPHALEVCWQLPRSGLVRVDALPRRAAGRLALLFADRSWIVVGVATSGLAEQFAAAVGHPTTAA
jgi:hypothetical protein